MDAQRRGEIALLLVEDSFHKNGLRPSREHNKKLEEISQSIGVSIEEMREFFKPMAEQLFEECFGECFGGE